MPNKLVVVKAALGTGKVVCLELLRCFKQGAGCVSKKFMVFKAA